MKRVAARDHDARAHRFRLLIETAVAPEVLYHQYAAALHLWMPIDDVLIGAGIRKTVLLREDDLRHGAE